MYLLRGEDFLTVHFPGIKNFSPQRHDRLKLSVASLLGRPPGGVALHQKQFRQLGAVAGTVCKLPRQRRPGRNALARHLLAILESPLGVVDTEFGKLFGIFRVLIQPQTERILHHARYKCRRFARGKALFGLAGKLWVCQFGGEDKTAFVPDIIRRQLHAARQQIAKLTEFPQSLQQASAQAIDVSTTLRGGYQINVALLGQLAAIRQPLQRPVHGLALGRVTAGEGGYRQHLPASGRPLQIIGQAILVTPAFGLTAVLVGKIYRQPSTEHRFGSQHMPQAGNRVLDRIKVFRIR